MSQSIPRDKVLGDKIRRLTASACEKYRMLEPDDRVLVAVSGGKDSLALVKVLADVKKRAPFPFSLEAVTFDPGLENFDTDAMGGFCEACSIPYHVIDEPVMHILQNEAYAEKLPCMMCARLRRGVLYTYAKKRGITKIALGHHREDANETLLMNLFYNGRIASMPPRLEADDGVNVVIRPMITVPEAWIARYAVIEEMPVQNPECPLHEGGEPVDTRREYVRRLIDTLEKDNPHVRGNLFSSLGRVQSRYLCMTRESENEPQKCNEDID